MEKNYLTIAERDELIERKRLIDIALDRMGFNEDQRRLTNKEIRKKYGLTEWQLRKLYESEAFKKTFADLVSEYSGDAIRQSIGRASSMINEIIDGLTELATQRRSLMVALNAYIKLYEIATQGNPQALGDDSAALREFLKANRPVAAVQVNVNGTEVTTTTTEDP